MQKRRSRAFATDFWIAQIRITNNFEANDARFGASRHSRKGHPAAEIRAEDEPLQRCGRTEAAQPMTPKASQGLKAR
jgi:hypothetical protein